MRTGLLLWTAALILTVTGLWAALRYRIVLGGLLIVGGMALGLLSSNYLP